MAKYKDTLILDDKVSGVLARIIKQFAGVKIAATKAQKAVIKMGNNMQNLGNSMIGVSLATGAFLKTSLDAWESQAAAIAIVENSLKSREKSLGRSSKQIQAMTTGIMENSIFADEEILQNVTNQLIGFDKVNAKTFDRANQAVVDMTSALFGANATAEKMRPIALGLGKALQTPSEAMNSLGRAGIKFTKAEQDLVKALISTNKQAEAQDYILSVVEKRYKGAAAELGNTQPLKKLANAFNDAQEPIGKIVEDFLIPLVKIATEMLKIFNTLPMPLKTFLVVLAGLTALAAPVLIFFGGLTSALGALAVVLGITMAELLPITLAIIGITAVVAGLVVAIIYLKNNWQRIFKQIADFTKNIVNQIMTYLKPLIDVIGFLMKVMPNLGVANLAVGAVKNAVGNNNTNNNKNVTINNNYAFKTGAVKVREEADINKISMKLSEHLFSASKNMGLAY